jgi:DNA recombination protein RmuC
VDSLVLVLLLLLAAAIAAVAALAFRGGASSLQVQLGELRSRLDDLVRAQQELPRAVAEGAAEQARSLADVGERLGRLAEVTTRLEEMGRSVTAVEELLKVPRLRGTLGEVWLEELLRQVFPPNLYRMQHGYRSGARVDAVVKIGDRLVPIDSKFPLEACQRMLASDGARADRERRAFRRSLRDRVDEIADKYIRPEEGTFDFAFMYVPAEAVYYEAVVQEQASDDSESLVAYALRRHVIPVSPHTFYAYLAAVLHGLRGLEVEQRAREIQSELGGLHQQIDRFQRAYELVGRHLEHAAKQYAESERQLVSVRARLTALTAVGADAELGPPAGVSPDRPSSSG